MQQVVVLLSSRFVLDELQGVRVAVTISVLLVLVGLINFVPVVGVLSADKLSQAYAVTLEDDNLVILLRHRALLFGLVGGFLLFAVYAPLYRPAAITMAAISMVGFLVFMFHQGGYNDALYKVMLADIVGIVLLAIAVGLQWVSR